MPKQEKHTSKPRVPTAREMLRPSQLRQTQLELMGDDVDVKDLYLTLNHIGIDIEEAVTDITIERTIDGASTLTVTVYDRDFTLLRSGRLSARNDTQIDGLYFRLKGVNMTGHTMTLTFEDREVAIMRTYSKPIKQSTGTSRGKLTRAEFILKMLKEVQEVPIRYIIPELHKAQRIDSAGKQPLTLHNLAVKGQGIAKVNNLQIDKPPHHLSEIQRNVANAVLNTGASMGLVRPMLVMGIMCAIQESKLVNLPLDLGSGSVGVFQQIAIYGWPASRDISKDATAFFNKLGVAYSNTPKKSYNDLIQEVQKSGYPYLYGQWRTQAEGIVNAYGVGDGTSTNLNSQWNATAGAQDYEFYRGLPPTSQLNKQKFGGKWGPENTWDCIQRLAGDVNWRAFMVSGVFYFMSEDQLIKSQPIATIDHSTPGIDDISGDYDEGKKTATLEIQCRIGRWVAPPGSVIQVQNMGPWNGRWLVSDINRSLYDSQGNITLKKALPRLPEPSGSNLQKDQTGGDLTLDYGGNPKPKDDTGKYPSNWVEGQPVIDLTSKGGLHDTGGLPGYPAYDWFAPSGSPCTAPIAGTISYMSGHDPALGAVEGAGGPLGWSVYIRGVDNNEYYLTHMGSRDVYQGQTVQAGQIIGTVADYKTYGRADHIHMGVHIGFDPNH